MYIDNIAKRFIKFTDEKLKQKKNNKDNILIGEVAFWFGIRITNNYIQDVFDLDYVIYETFISLHKVIASLKRRASSFGDFSIKQYDFNF